MLAAGGSSNGVETIRPPAGGEPGFLRLPVLCRAGARGDSGARRLGIAPGYPKALCDLTAFGERALNAAEDFAGARRLADTLTTLPTHSRLAERDVGALERWLR